MIRNNLKATIFDSITLAYLFMIAIYLVVRPTEEQIYNLQNIFAFTAPAAILGLLSTIALYMAQVKTLGQIIFEPAHKKNHAPVRAWYATFWGWQLFVTFTVTFVVGGALTQLSLRELLHRPGLLGAQRIFSALMSPEWSILPKGIWAIVETIYIAFMSTVIAVPVAFVLSFMCARNIMQNHWYTSLIYNLLRIFMNVTRSIEPLIWAIIFSVWVGIGPFAGMLALMLHSVSSLVKQYSEIIECVDDGPIEGVSATGASQLQVIWFAIVPQVMLPFVSFTIFRWDINVRMATIIGLVGGGGIGNLFIQYQGQALWREVGTLALLIVLVVWIMDAASTYIREAIK